jgi:hypothetical protein
LALIWRLVVQGAKITLSGTKFNAGGHSSCCSGSDGQRRQLAGVHAGHHVFVSNRFQVDHRGSEIFMPHPILQRFDVADVILLVARRKRVPKLVQEEVRTIWTLGALVAVLRDALPAVQIGMERDTLEFGLVALVWSTLKFTSCFRSPTISVFSIRSWSLKRYLCSL